MRRLFAPDEDHKPIYVLVSTTETQGFRDSDFCHAQEGEIVHWTFDCDTDRNDPDGRCGCRRSMTSFDSGFATTTFKVTAIDMSEREFIAKYAKQFTRAHRLSYKQAKECVIELLEVAACFPIDYVLERRGEVIQTRGDSESTAE